MQFVKSLGLGLFAMIFAFTMYPPERRAEAEVGQAVGAAVVADTAGIVHAAETAVAVFGLGAVAVPWVVIVGVFGGLAYLVVMHRSRWAAAHRAAIESAAAKAFGIVENLKLTGRLADGANKSELAVVELRRILSREQLPVTDQVLAAAQDIWNAMHAETKTAAIPGPVGATGAAGPAGAAAVVVLPAS